MQTLNHKTQLTAATLLAFCLGSYWYASTAEAAELRDITKINGGVRIQADERVGDISSINGSVDLRQGASAGAVETVNGGIDLDDQVVIFDAETVNGGIRVGRDVVVHGSLRTVNGGIRTDRGTVVDQRVQTVNGRILLRNTQVKADVQTASGDIELRDGSVVAGDIIVKGGRSWLARIFMPDKRPSEIDIDSASSVLGDIHLYRKTELRIADGAQVGSIIEHY